MYLIRDVYLGYIRNSYNLVVDKSPIFKKWTKDLNRHFSKEDIQTFNKHMIRRSTSFPIREIQVKTTMRYCFILTKMTVIKKTDNNKAWLGCGEIIHYIHTTVM